MENWNTHRIRSQKIELPSGVPDQIFAFPTSYGGRQSGNVISKDIFREAAELSGVLEASTEALMKYFMEDACNSYQVLIKLSLMS